MRHLLFLLITAVVATAQTVAPAPDLASNPASTTPTLNPARPTLFIAGDSTAARGRGAAQQGWAVPFADYFDPAKVNVVNRARGGRSSRTFITEGLWDQLLADVKAGDTVLIQFGHNDGSPVAEDPSTPRQQWRFRGSVPGLGEETREIENLLTNKREVVHTFGWYLRKMIADTRAKGATPILLSITVRNEWKDGKVERRNGPWSELTAELAKQEKVAFIDLTTRIADDYEKRGEEVVKGYFPKDHTHTGPEGALINAQHVVAGLRDLPGDPFAAYVLPSAK